MLLSLTRWGGHLLEDAELDAAEAANALEVSQAYLSDPSGLTQSDLEADGFATAIAGFYAEIFESVDPSDPRFGMADRALKRACEEAPVQVMDLVSLAGDGLAALTILLLVASGWKFQFTRSGPDGTTTEVSLEKSAVPLKDLPKPAIDTLLAHRPNEDD